MGQPRLTKRQKERRLAAASLGRCRDKDRGTASLLKEIRHQGPALKRLRRELAGSWADAMYWFYRGSFKLYRLQDATLKIVRRLKKLSPRPLNGDFEDIIREGTGKVFHTRVNWNWMSNTRPILEAFCHARWFLELATEHVDEIGPNHRLPSGFEPFLDLFGLG